MQMQRWNSEAEELEFIKRFAAEFFITIPKNSTVEEAREWVQEHLSLDGLRYIEGECSKPELVLTLPPVIREFTIEMKIDAEHNAS